MTADAKKRRRERGKLNRGAKIQQTGGNDQDEASPVPIVNINKFNMLRAPSAALADKICHPSDARRRRVPKRRMRADQPCRGGTTTQAWVSAFNELQICRARFSVTPVVCNR
jgi:hypothetical protein